MILKRKLMEDGVPCHITCSAMSGFCATVVGSPVDVIKTRIMNADKTAGSPGVLSTVKNLI